MWRVRGAVVSTTLRINEPSTSSKPPTVLEVEIRLFGYEIETKRVPLVRLQDLLNVLAVMEGDVKP